MAHKETALKDVERISDGVRYREMMYTNDYGKTTVRITEEDWVPGHIAERYLGSGRDWYEEFGHVEVYGPLNRDGHSHKAQVNWSAYDSQDVAHTERYMRLMTRAVEIAKQLDALHG